MHYHLTTSARAAIKRTMVSADENVGEREDLHSVGGDVN
jgi:hypothetical protein